MLDTMMKVSLTLVAFDKMSKVIRDAVNKSNSEFDKLQNKIQTTAQSLDALGQNMTKLGAGLTLAGGGLAYKLGITQAIPEALALEHQLRELGNVGQLSAEQLAEMDERLGSISRYTNQFRSEIAEGLNVLVWQGAWIPTKGDALRVYIGYVGEKLLNCGIFEIDEIEYSAPPDSIVVKGLATGIKKAFRQNNSVAYENKTLKQIANEIAKKHNLTLVGEIDDVKVERITQTLNKELAYYDYKNNIAYKSPKIPTVVDESNEYYLDLVFNIDED